MQARFLIPMAISIGFGILFVTAIILLIVPAAYLILEDFLGLVRTEQPARQQPAALPIEQPEDRLPQPVPQPD